MASKKAKPGAKDSLPFHVSNKERRQVLHVRRKKALEGQKRDERMRRRREEDKDPRLRDARLKNNKTVTLDQKRIWDDVDSDMEDALGAAVDVGHIKRMKNDDEADVQPAVDQVAQNDEEESEGDSMLDSGSEPEDDKPEDDERQDSPQKRASSPVASATSTNLDMTPEFLARKFPTILSDGPPPVPKILITTSLNSTLHKEGNLLTTLFPHSTYIPRSAHRYSHKFSVREICGFAANRQYTCVIVLDEDQKKVSGMSMVHLPHGPTFHFSVSNWVEGKRMPGHGRPTEHIPELILNNFRTPLGVLTAHFFRTLFPAQPELQGRQVVTLHNQRDYIFWRRHRYVFREKRTTERNVVGPDGKDVKGVEGIRAGLQELGPRFTLKLRRIDRGIQRASGQEWEWKGKMDKARTKFQL